MTRYLIPYLCALSITTSTVILAGAAAVHLSRTIDRMGNHSGHLGDPGNPPPTVDSPRRGVPVARAGGSLTVVALTMVVQPPGPAYPSRQGGGRSYQQMADNAAKICGLSEPEDQAMFRRLIQRESEWNPEAVSAAGAIGLAQVMPRSAISPTLDVRDPWQNLVAGACLLRQYRDRFGSWRVALHAYHGGPTRVGRRRVAQSSRNYAQDVIGGNE